MSKAVVLVAALVVGLLAAQEPGEPEAIAPPKPIVVPDTAKNTRNPVPATAESIEHGRMLFASQCAMCHGKTGDGKGDLAPRLGVPVPDLGDPVKAQARTDGELYYIISQGHAKMPGNEVRLHEEWRWDLVNAMRSMVRRSG